MQPIHHLVPVSRRGVGFSNMKPYELTAKSANHKAHTASSLDEDLFTYMSGRTQRFHIKGSLSSWLARYKGTESESAARAAVQEWIDRNIPMVKK